MNRNHLALFHWVASAGGISAGAALARVSQPAVSKQIADLEDALGVTLLERRGRGSRLTQAGTVLADYARRWMALEAEAEQAIQEIRGLKRGKLRIGASLTVGGYLLAPVIADFHRKHPRIELKLEVANTEAIERMLLEGRIDVGLTEGDPGSEALSSEVFFEDELVALAHPEHPLAAARRVRVRQLAGHPFILREQGSGTRLVVEQALGRHGLRIEPALTLASQEAIRGAVAAGLGLAFLPRSVVAADLAAGKLVQVRLVDLEIHRPLHLQRLRGSADSPALAAFLSVLSSRLRVSSRHRVKTVAAWAGSGI